MSISTALRRTCSRLPRPTRLALLCAAMIGCFGVRAAALTPASLNVAVASASLSYTWQLDNPVEEAPFIAFSTMSDFSVTLSSWEGSVGQQDYTFTDLTPNLTYYFRVKVSTEDDISYAGLETATLIETPEAVYIDEVASTSLVMSGWAPAYTSLYSGQSGVNVSIEGAYQSWRTGGTWSAKTGDILRAEMGLASYAGRLYAVGGYDGSYLNTHKFYDPDSNSWTALPAAMGQARDGLVYAAAGRRLYAIGGSTAALNSYVSTNATYDPAANSWAAMADMPTPRRGFAVGYISGKLYAVGGFNGTTALGVTEEYDPVSNTWAAKAALLYARSRPGVGAINGKLYVAGGLDGNSYYNTTEEFDPELNAWALKAPMSVERAGLGAAVVGGKLYAVGGSSAPASPPLALAEEYEPVGNTWRTLAAMPTARAGLGIAASGGKLYTVGGINGPGNYLNSNEAYDPGTSFKFTGLTPNTLYTFRAKARNRAGAETPESPDISTYTLAALPGAAAAAFSPVGASSFTLNWTANGNPLGSTLYRVQVSTDPAFGYFAASSDVNSTFTALSGFLANTTYYARVAAINSDNLITDFRSLGSTVTLTETPVGVLFDEISTFSITASAAGAQFTNLYAGRSGLSLSRDGGAYSAWRAADTWASKAAMTPRKDFALASAGGKLYAIGGFNGAEMNTNEEYDPVANAWTSRANMPTSRAYLAAAAAAGKIYAVGGGTTSATNEMYDPVSNTWATKASMITARVYLAAVSLNGKIYAVGGSPNSMNEVYDPSSNSWSSKAALPSLRYYLAAAAYSGKIYAVGGSGGPQTNEVFDPGTNQWTALAAMPTGRQGLGLAALGGRLYAMGGVGPLSANEEYNIALDTWTARTALPTARGNLAVTMTGARIYAVGGGHNLSYFGNVEQYDPGLGVAYTGLLPNTQYSFAARSANALGAWGPASPTVSTWTLAAVPGAVSVTGRTDVSISVTWNSGGNPLPGTSYALKYSTYAAFTVAYSSVVTSTYTTLTGLNPDTTYYFDVAAINGDGVYSAYAGTTASTVTLASVPGAPSITSRSASSHGLSWSANGNPSWTTYLLKYSTSPVFTLSVTTVAPVSSTFTAVTGLQSGTSYYYDVAAVNRGGLASAYTGSPVAGYTMPPVPGDPVPTPLGTSSISWTWALAPSATGYNLYSTSSVLLTSVVAPPFVQTNLSTNTFNGLMVSAVSLVGESPLTAAVSTWTLAAPPLALSTGPASVSSTSIAVQWGANDNPAGTSFSLRYWPQGGSTTTVATTDVSTAAYGLAADTTHYFRVTAYNGAGIVTAASVLTMTTLPGMPVNLFGNSPFTGELAWNWNGQQTVRYYNIYLGTQPVLSGTAPGASYYQIGLGSNTLYNLSVSAVNLAGEGEVTPPLGVYTRAAAPGPPAVTLSSVTQVRISWNSRGNPDPGTDYRVKYSTSAAFAVAVTTETLFISTTSALVTGLAPNTSYYFDVEALSGDNVHTGYTGSPVSTVTLAAVPGAPYISGGTDITQAVAWPANGNPQTGTTYRLKYSTSPGFEAPVTTVTVLASTYTTVPNLLPNTSYYYDVQAIGRTGLLTAYTGAPAAAYTMAEIPGVPVLLSRTTDTQTLEWSPAGNPTPGTNYYLEYSTSPGFEPASTASVVSASTFTTVAGLLPGTSYFYHVASLNRTGNRSAFSGGAAQGYTLSVPPVVVAGTPLGISSVSWTWSASTGAVTYRIYSSTDLVTPLAEQAGPPFVHVGLASNTYNGVSISAVNPAGEGPQSPMYLRWTLAAVPGAPGIVAVSSHSQTLTWGDSGNSDPQTDYVLRYSTSPGFEAAVTAYKSAASTYTVVTGLLAGTSYFFAAAAVNVDLATSAYSVSTAAYTLPDRPSAPAVQVHGPSSVTWTWAAVTGASAYAVHPATASGNVIASTAAPSFLHDGLPANTLVSVTVSAFDPSGEGAQSLSASTYTLAALPGAPVVGTRTAVSQDLNWAANGNPAGTTYKLRRSTSADFVPYTETTLISTSASVGSLQLNTSYYYDVAAVNASGIWTAFTGTPAARYTLAATPGYPYLVAASSFSHGVEWLSGGNPEGSPYVLRYSTAGDFAAAVTTLSLVYQTSSAVSGLQPNTEYFYSVAAITGDGALTSYAVHPTQSQGRTLAAVPGAPYAVARSSVSQTISWDPAGNPSGTQFNLIYSLSPVFAFPSFSKVVVSTYAAVTGLQPGSSYYFDVAAINGADEQTAFTGHVLESPTLPALPGTPTAQPLGVSSITWTWTPVAGALSYDIHAASSPGALFSSTTGTSFTWTGLSTNTPYGIVLAPVDSGGPGELTSPSTAYTLAMPPVALSTGPLDVSSFSITVQWGSNTNPPGTMYEALCWNGASTAAAVTTSLSSAVLTGLADSATYFITVRAMNGDGVDTATASLTRPTLAAPPSGLAGAPSGATSIVWTWTPVVTASGYKIYSSSVQTSLLGTVAAASFTETDLSTDTSAGVVVSVVNQSGEGLKSAAVSTYTLAAQPLALSTGPLAATAADITVQWDSNGNAPGTTYSLDYWAGGATSTVTTALTSATLSGLTGGTVYYFRVRAANTLGVFSVPAQLTAATLPQTPSKPVGTAVSDSAISWDWPPVPSALYYNIYLSTQLSVVVATAAAPPYLHSGLLPNSAYSVAVAPVNYGGEGPQSQPGFVALTLAAAPDPLAAAAVYITSATLTWGLNGNPAGTEAAVSRSTGGLVYTETVAGAVTSYDDTGLAGCTTYYFRVRNRNGDSVFGAYSSTISVFTRGVEPLPPGGLSARSLAGNRIELSWLPSLSGAVTKYTLYTDSGTGNVDYGAPAAVFTSTETSYTTPVLASSAAYTFALRAALCGTEEGNISVTASAAAMAALPQSGAEVMVPQSGRRVDGTRLTLMAALYSGSAAGTKQVLFQFKTSTDTGWTDVPAALPAVHPNPDTAEPYLTHWDVSGLNAGYWQLRAVAYDLADSSDTAAPAINVIVDHADPEISEVAVSGAVQKRQLAYNAVATTVRTADAASARTVGVAIPSGALAASTETVSLVANPALLPPDPADALPCGSAAEIKLLSGQTSLSGGQTAVVTLSYADADGNGIVDGTGLRASALRMYSASSLAGPWTRDFSSAVNTADRTVTGSTPHFSYFALFAPLGASLDGVQVFPVPYVPGDADPDNGKVYDGTPGTGITFDKLPSSVRIKVYTLSGQLAASFGSDNTSGKLQWDVKNKDGKYLATGGYLAVISSPGLDPVTKKLLVIR